MPDVMIIVHDNLYVSEFTDVNSSKSIEVSSPTIEKMSDWFYVSENDLKLLKDNIKFLNTKFTTVSIVEKYDTSHVANFLNKIKKGDTQ